MTHFDIIITITIVKNVRINNFTVLFFFLYFSFFFFLLVLFFSQMELWASRCSVVHSSKAPTSRATAVTPDLHWLVQWTAIWRLLQTLDLCQIVFTSKLLVGSLLQLLCNFFWPSLKFITFRHCMRTFSPAFAPRCARLLLTCLSTLHLLSLSSQSPTVSSHTHGSVNVKKKKKKIWNILDSNIFKLALAYQTICSSIIHTIKTAFALHCLCSQIFPALL